MGYDNWLLCQASDYWEECEPEVVSTDYEVDYDEDGNMFSYPQYTMNCEKCDNKDCEHWEEFNNDLSSLNEQITD